VKVIHLNKELGFVNTREIFKKADASGYVVGAFNFVTLEQRLAIVEACIESEAPFILQSSAKFGKIEKFLAVLERHSDIILEHSPKTKSQQIVDTKFIFR
jgi:fructose/tagatose bisphosphate aldolase